MEVLHRTPDVAERREPRPGRHRCLLDRLVGIHGLTDRRKRKAACGGEMVVEQPAERGTVAGPRKCHQANDFRVGGVGFDIPCHHDRKRQFSRVHDR